MTPHPTEPEAGLDKAALEWETALPLAANHAGAGEEEAEPRRDAR